MLWLFLPDTWLGTGSLRHGTIVFLNDCKGFIRIEVAGQNQGAVVRDIPAVKKVLTEFNTVIFNILHPAENRIVIRVDLKSIGIQLLVDSTETAVVGTLSTLILNDLPLSGQHIIRDLQILQSLCFKRNDQLQLVGGNRLVKHRHILSSVSVEMTTVGLDDIGVNFRTVLEGAAEHHMLEEVREPQLAADLHTGTDTDPGLQIDDRGGMILNQQ